VIEIIFMEKRLKIAMKEIINLGNSLEKIKHRMNVLSPISEKIIKKNDCKKEIQKPKLNSSTCFGLTAIFGGELTSSKVRLRTKINRLKRTRKIVDLPFFS